MYEVFLFWLMQCGGHSNPTLFSCRKPDNSKLEFKQPQNLLLWFYCNCGCVRKQHDVLNPEELDH